MNRERIDKWCEWGILGLVLSALVFAPLATGAVRTLEFLIVEGLVAAAVVLWMVRMWFAPRHLFLWPPICWAVVAFLLYAIYSCHVAVVEYVAQKELVRIITYTFLFFLIIINLNRQESTQIIMVTLISLAMVIAVYAIYQFATNATHVWHFVRPAKYLKRGGGTFINPNHLAGFLEMILPMGLAYILLGRFSHVVKILFGYACLMILIGIGITLSRGGWLATGTMLFLACGLLFFYRDFRIPSIVMLVVLIGIGVVFLKKTDEAQKRVENAIKGSDLRPHFWDGGIKMWQSSPWLGVGPGHFDLRFREFRSVKIPSRPVYTHNDYINTLADWGIAGLALVMTTVGLFYWGIFKTWPHVQRSTNDLGTKRSNKAALVFGGGLAVLALLVHAIFEFNMQIPANAMVAIALMAMIGSMLRFATERFWFTPRIYSKIILTLLCSGGVFYLGKEAVVKAREYVHLQQAEMFPEYSQNKLTSLEAAFAVQPNNFENAYDIGEIYRIRSWSGDFGYEKWAREALVWFERGIKLNPYDPYNYMRYGMCLDWLGKHTEAAPYYEKSLKLDPHGYYVAAMLGWHNVETGDYVTAKKWFEQSLRYYDNTDNRNPIPANYLRIVNRKLAEQAQPAK